MSRRQGGRERVYTKVNIVCVCGVSLGRVYKQAGHYGFTGAVELRDATGQTGPQGYVSPERDSGKVAARCPECWAEFQRRWVKVRTLLDEMEKRGMKSADLT